MIEQRTDRQNMNQGFIMEDVAEPLVILDELLSFQDDVLPTERRIDILACPCHHVHLTRAGFPWASSFSSADVCCSVRAGGGGVQMSSSSGISMSPATSLLLVLSSDRLDVEGVQHAEVGGQTRVVEGGR